MKEIINGKRYDTRKMTELCSQSVYHNGNYAGANHLLVSDKGNFAIFRSSNGQDCWRTESIQPLDGVDEAINAIEGWRLSDDEIHELEKHGVIIPEA